MSNDSKPPISMVLKMSALASCCDADIGLIVHKEMKFVSFVFIACCWFNNNLSNKLIGDWL